MEKTIIEVNGVKMEVDLRQAKRIDTLQVGDRVKVLIKGYSDYKVHAGTVIGFEPFKALPTVIVAYLDKDYSSVNVKFLYFNANTKESEIVKAIDDDQLDIDKATVLQQFERELQKKRDEISDIEAKRDFFIANFKAYWPEYAPVLAPQVD
jgi:translation elongation factor EF-1alpha